jgi:hypothetical protein
VALQLIAAAPNNPIFNANSAGSFSAVWMQNDTWTEGSGTPSAPTLSGITYSSLQGVFSNPLADQGLGTFSYNGASSGTFSYTLGLSSGLIADVFAGDSVTLRLQPADGSVSYLFDSRSFGTAASRPLLSITAVPEPASVALLALGGLLWLARKTARH